MRRLLLILVLFTSCSLSAQVKSPFNQLSLPDSMGIKFSFLVSGHFHGSSQNTSGFPAATLLANLGMINQSGCVFLGSTGDLFLDVTKNIPQYKMSFFEKLKIPLFNAVGNHDLTGNTYQDNFGNTWFSFDLARSRFIFLDTEESDGSIKGDQLSFLKKALNTKSNHVFIFSHRPVWAEEDAKLKNVFLENTVSYFGTNFQSDILPLLRKKRVYWFSGSLGGQAPASFFYFNKYPNLTYIQSAIRDLPRDGLLKVNVEDSLVTFETISLTGQEMPKLETCNLDKWKRNAGESTFNYRLIPLYVKQMLFHRYFWYGIVAAILSWVMLRFSSRFFKRKGSAKA